MRRVQIKHQPVLVGSHGFEREHLWQHGLLQVNNQAHDTWRVLTDPNAGNVRIIGLDLGHQFAQCRNQVNTFNVHGQAWRVGNKKLPCLDLAIRLNRQPRVVFGWPDAHCHNCGPTRNMLHAQEQYNTAQLQGLPSAEWI